MQVYCSNCGKEIKAEHTFCGHCGFKTAQSKSEPVVEGMCSDKKSKLVGCLAVIGYILGGIFFVIVCIVIGAILGTSVGQVIED